MTFRVGQKVVCVDASLYDGAFWAGDIPQEGEIYTISSVVEIHRGTGLCLAEIKNHAEFDASYSAARFRPLVETKSSASFTIGADPDSDRWDNRKKRKEKV